jgi:hypothetical protein
MIFSSAARIPFKNTAGPIPLQDIELIIYGKPNPVCEGFVKA